jgi:myo-inositol-1(or 4)-monophosphatase
MPSSSLDLAALARTCEHAAARAAAFIAEHASQLATVTWEHKGPADFVSAVDRGAEDLCRELLLGAYPDARFLGEESYDPSQGLGDGLAFVVDPLDGTTNFLHGFPWYAVSIGATVAGELVAGVVRNVATGELFTATRGGGATRDGRPIRVSTIADPPRALVGTGFPFKELDRLDGFLRQFAEVTRHTAGVRRPGSAALDLCDVACGRFDAFWELTLAPWDVAAGILLVREAGGVVTDLRGAPARVAHAAICAGNPAMHRWLRDVVRDGA